MNRLAGALQMQKSAQPNSVMVVLRKSRASARIDCLGRLLTCRSELGLYYRFQLALRKDKAGREEAKDDIGL